jgi:arsenical pump membrane protein
MQLLIACSTFALSVALAVKRPAISPTIRISPAAAAMAGVVCLLATGTVGLQDLTSAARMLWRPTVTILAILVTTFAAERTGTIDAIAARVLGPRAGSIPALFRAVFLLSLTTATILSNDAAILLVTPLVVTFVRRRFPTQPRLLLPFAFAVFMAAGVAPFITSNPMNVVVASAAGLNFNTYAATMIPIAVAGSLTTYLLLRRVFAADLAAGIGQALVRARPAVLSPAQRRMVMLLLAVSAMYPFVALLDGSAIWAVSAAGAVLALGLAAREEHVSPVTLLRQGRGAGDILIFLPAVFVLAMGLRNAGLTNLLASWYEGAGIALVGATAAVGSAALNNHPMAVINLMTLDPSSGDPALFLAALIGGDLGPRLMPTGSLAGLLWLEACRRLGVEVTPVTFMRVGLVLTVPALVVSLLVLAMR